MEIFEYKTKLSYTNFITPAIGAFSIYMAFTNNAGLAYRGKLVLPYPASSFFLRNSWVFNANSFSVYLFKIKKRAFNRVQNERVNLHKRDIYN